ncbi:hypothetical protein LCGC14_1789690 [marine sediment metagenome]|uniref:Uncharacterized protein n=1 Tax=marine sediment metagenome TaxID=412755 RepID=A0A0F9GSZ8_9ZZZZ
MKGMEELKFMVDINQRFRSESLDDIFSCASFIVKFNNFLLTKSAKKWLTKEEGKRFVEWLEN